MTLSNLIYLKIMKKWDKIAFLEVSAILGRQTFLKMTLSNLK